MEIRFNLTGAARKELVKAVGEFTGTQPVYQKTPTFAYNIGPLVIDKQGTMTGEVTEALLDALAQQGFESPPAQTGDAEETATSDVSVQHDSDTGSFVISVPKEFFIGSTILNLEKLVASKAELIKSALDVDSIPIEQDDNTVHFPWFRRELTPEEVGAYCNFISMLCVMARNAKHISAKEKPVDNEKYAFRCFLLRLGFIGAEYKADRKILLRNLSGNSSFKSGQRSAKVEEACDE